MDKLSLYDKILFPVVTEKSTNLSEQNKIVFKVPVKANKKIVKKSIEKIFKVRFFNKIGYNFSAFGRLAEGLSWTCSYFTASK